MNPNKALWGKGDFTEIAVFMRQSGEAFAKSLVLTPPLRVLDLGCGDGTTALPLAQLGADVVGIDVASNLVAAAGLANLNFQEGQSSQRQPKAHIAPPGSAKLHFFAWTIRKEKLH